MGNVRARLKGAMHNLRGYKYREVLISIDALDCSGDDCILSQNLVYSLLKSCFSKLNSGYSDCYLKYDGSLEKFSDVEKDPEVLARDIKYLGTQITVNINCEDEKNIEFALDSNIYIGRLIYRLECQPSIHLKNCKVKTHFKGIVSKQQINLSTNKDDNLKYSTFVFDSCTLDTLYVYNAVDIKIINNSHIIMVSSFDLNSSTKDCPYKEISARLDNRLSNSNSLIKIVLSAENDIFGYSTDNEYFVSALDKLEAKLSKFERDINSLKVATYLDDSYIINKRVFVDKSSQALFINIMTDMGRICQDNAYTLMYSKCDYSIPLSNSADESDKLISYVFGDILSVISYKDTDYFPVRWGYNSEFYMGESLGVFKRKLLWWQ